jgi:3'-phosphoadenosine 5'-phosphosulfate sulfotransferase (PAPS reductase)/FAD synthetase
MNVYKIVPPFYVSFSGGRTSAYMLRQVLDAWGGSLPSGGHVLFANTGREHPATYDFVERIGLEWCPVTWVEWRREGFAEVLPAHASRNGEPFADLIRKRKFLPNPIARFCTSDLKVIPMRKWMESKGYDDFTTVIGLRADEQRRVAKLRGDRSRDISMPLADAGVNAEMVKAYWRNAPFDLQLPNGDSAFGNCDLCFLKNRAATDRVIELEPQRAQWWIDLEHEIGGTFRKDRPPYATILHQVTIQGRLFTESDDPNDTTIPCDCTE